MNVRAQKTPWGDDVELLVFCVENGKRFVASPPTMQPVPSGQTQEATLVMNKTSAQVLMDDLWNAGVRPTDGSGSAGSLKATQNHLADMRAIVFSNIKKAAE
jgi:hypothetical protein